MVPPPRFVSSLAPAISASPLSSANRRMTHFAAGDRIGDGTEGRPKQVTAFYRSPGHGSTGCTEWLYVPFERHLAGLWVSDAPRGGCARATAAAFLRFDRYFRSGSAATCSGRRMSSSSSPTTSKMRRTASLRPLRDCSTKPSAAPERDRSGRAEPEHDGNLDTRDFCPDTALCVRSLPSPS